jgi:hypothetical protein
LFDLSEIYGWPLNAAASYPGYVPVM